MVGKVFQFGGTARAEGRRARNRSDVMQLLLSSPGIDRTRLAQATGLTNAAMTQIVRELIDAGLVRDTGQLDSDGMPGRRRSGLQIEAGGGMVLGLSVLAFNSSVALTDIAGRVIDVTQVTLRDLRNPDNTLDEISSAAFSLLQKHDVDVSHVLGAGVATTGYLSAGNEVVDSSPYIGWPVFDIRQGLVRRLKMNVAIDNVNRCLAVAENRTGMCRGVQDFVLLRAAIGIGAAIVSNGVVVCGSNNRAGHIGHNCVQTKGVPCTCGARGCLNTIASGWAILHQLDLVQSGIPSDGDLESHEVKLRHVLSPEFETDNHYQTVIRKAGEALAKHTRGLLQSVDPQSVVLTGPLGRNAVYCAGFRNVLSRYNINVELLTANEHGITGPAVAASILALASHVYSPSLDIDRLAGKNNRDHAGLAAGTASGALP